MRQGNRIFYKAMLCYFSYILLMSCNKSDSLSGSLCLINSRVLPVPKMSFGADESELQILVQNKYVRSEIMTPSSLRIQILLPILEGDYVDVLGANPRYMRGDTIVVVFASWISNKHQLDSVLNEPIYLRVQDSNFVLEKCQF